MPALFDTAEARDLHTATGRIDLPGAGIRKVIGACCGIAQQKEVSSSIWGGCYVYIV